MIALMKTEKKNIFQKYYRRFDNFFFRFTYLDYEDFTLVVKIR